MVNLSGMEGKGGVSGSRRAQIMTGPYAPLVQAVALAPLVAFYELALALVGHRIDMDHPIDVWTRSALARVGLTAWYLPGALILVVLLLAHIYRRDPWRIDAGRLGRLWGEALLLTVPLVVIYLMFTLPVHRVFAGPLSLFATDAQLAFVDVVRYVGAGLFEEFAFRLVLISGLLWGMQKLFGVPVKTAQIIAVFVAAAAFSAAHHAVIGGQDYSHMVYLFRVAAGIYLGGVFITRGFATATLAHAAFNCCRLFLPD